MNSGTEPLLFRERSFERANGEYDMSVDIGSPNQYSGKDRQMESFGSAKSVPNIPAISARLSISCRDTAHIWGANLYSEFPTLYYFLVLFAVIPTSQVDPLSGIRTFRDRTDAANSCCTCRRAFVWFYAIYRTAIAILVLIGAFCTSMAFVSAKHEGHLTGGWGVSLTSWLTVWFSFALGHHLNMYYFSTYGADFLKLLRVNLEADRDFRSFVARLLKRGFITAAIWTLLEGCLYGAYWYPAGNDPAMTDFSAFIGSPTPVHILIVFFMIAQFWLVGGLVLFCIIIAIYCRPVVLQLRQLAVLVLSQNGTYTPTQLWADILSLRGMLRGDNKQITAVVLFQLFATVLDTGLLLLSQFLTPPMNSSAPIFGLDIFSYITLFMRIVIVVAALLFMSDIVSSFENLVRTLGECTEPEWNVVSSPTAYRVYMHLKTEEPLSITLYSIVIPKRVVLLTTFLVVIAQFGSTLSRLRPS